MAIIINRRDSEEAMRFKHAIKKMQESLETISDLSDKMEDEYGERYSMRGGYGERGGLYGQRGYRGNYRDDEMDERDYYGERRMRDYDRR